MRDPHVEALMFEFQPAEQWEYVDPPRLEGQTADFTFELENGILTLLMKKHYASVQEAQFSVAGFLLIWEVDATLRLGQGAVKFVYLDARVTDRMPAPGTDNIYVTGLPIGLEVGPVTVRDTQNSYPGPPSHMSYTPNLETLWKRYQAYREKRELLPAMAYFCLTLIEHCAGGRKSASRKYSIDFRVLDKLGRLTSERGDLTSARKMGKSLKEHTPLELIWIEEAVKRLIKRVGELAADPACARITLHDLPRLE